MNPLQTAISQFSLRFIYIIASMLMVSLLSCYRDESDDEIKLEEALDLAGNNRTELERVLTHYSSSKDSLKYKAAIFLIANMPGKYSKVFPNYLEYKTVFDTIACLNSDFEKTGRYIEFYKYYKKSVINTFLSPDLVAKRNSSSMPIILEDIKTISSRYLIENIDYAFEAWKLPWAKHLEFLEFCEFILPYRYGNEELQPWRKTYFESCRGVIEILKLETDPVVACSLVNRIGEKSFSELNELAELANAIRPLDLIRINTSTSCTDQAGLGVLKMRGLGIPVGKLNIPCWGNRGTGHDLNGVYSKRKKWIPYQTGEQGPGIYKFHKFFYAPKIYLELYSSAANGSYVIGQEGSYKVIDTYQDVTGDIIRSSDISVSYNGAKDGSSLGLCVFNNSKWIPIAVSPISNGKAGFQRIGRNIIYMTSTFEGGNIKLIGQPFVVDSLGSIRHIVPKSSKQTLSLDRKYPPNQWINEKLHELEGGVVQASNDSSFSNNKVLWKIGRIESTLQMTKKLSNEKYKYVRFVYPNIKIRNEGLADIAFVSGQGSKRSVLGGEIISSMNASSTFFRTIFDQSPLNFVLILNRNYGDFKQFYDGTWLIIPKEGRFWVGMAFKESEAISEVRIIPRTDDNNINIGETYELFYWDRAWVSLGSTTATTNMLTFSGPKEALYLLRNVDRGKEHRLFLYQDDKQVWY